MSEKKAYCTTLEECLEKWSDRIDALETEATKAEGPFKADCCARLDQLKSIGTQMKTKLEEIKKAGDHEWKSLREEAEKIRKELEKTSDFPISRFR